MFVKPAYRLRNHRNRKFFPILDDEVCILIGNMLHLLFVCATCRRSLRIGSFSTGYRRWKSILIWNLESRADFLSGVFQKESIVTQIPNVFLRFSDNISGGTKVFGDFLKGGPLPSPPPPPVKESQKGNPTVYITLQPLYSVYFSTSTQSGNSIITTTCSSEVNF